MKHIKTFESFSILEEEGLFSRIMKGSKKLSIDGKDLQSLLADPEMKKDFSMNNGKPAGTKRAMNLYSSLKNNLNMEPEQALEAAMKIVQWNGFMVVDAEESVWDPAKKELTAVKAEGAASGKVF